MPVSPDSWEVAGLLLKLLIYLSILGVIGGSAMLGLTRDHSGFSVRARPMLRRYHAAAALGGLLGLLLYFMVQVGGINQRGMVGMLDSSIAEIVAASSIGSGLRMRAAGFMMAALAVLAMLLPGRRRRPARRAAFVLSLLAAALLAWSFTVLGHVATLSFSARLAISLHVIAVSLWAGSLLPLYLLCRRELAKPLAPLLQQFGTLAWLVVLTLILSGAWLLVQLLASPAELFTSAYGLALLGKMLLVSMLLALGALNKFRLVPQMQRSGSTLAMQRSIGIEILLVLLVLSLTAVLTSVLGPARLM